MLAYFLSYFYRAVWQFNFLELSPSAIASFYSSDRYSFLLRHSTYTASLQKISLFARKQN
jgi:hypothetical protein